MKWCILSFLSFFFSLKNLICNILKICNKKYASFIQIPHYPGKCLQFVKTSDEIYTLKMIKIEVLIFNILQY